MTTDDDAVLVQRALAMVSEVEANTEAARILGVSEGTVRRWRAGDIALPLRRPTRDALRYSVLTETAEERPEDAMHQHGADWLDDLLGMVRQVNGEDENPATLALKRDILEGIARLWTIEGKEREASRARAALAELEKRAPPSDPRRLTAGDVLRIYDRESAAADKRAEGLRDWAAAVRIAEENAGDRQREVSSAARDLAADLEAWRAAVALDTLPPGSVPPAGVTGKSQEGGGASRSEGRGAGGQ